MRQAVANLLRQRQPKIPVMTIDADLLEADRDLRLTYLGTDNYQMGVLMAQHLQELKAEGGTVCLQLGNVAADNINARAAGFRDTIAGTKGTDRLKGEGGWTEIEGCPVFTNDQIDLANQQMADVFTAHPDLSAFILVGGWAQFGPQAYAQVTDQVMDRLKSKELIIVAGDTLPPQMDALKAGRSHAQIGQRPFEMGYRAPVGDDRPDRRQAARSGALYRPRRVHGGQHRRLSREVRSNSGRRRTAPPYTFRSERGDTRAAGFWCADPFGHDRPLSEAISRVERPGVCADSMSLVIDGTLRRLESRR